MSATGEWCSSVGGQVCLILHVFWGAACWQDVGECAALLQRKVGTASRLACLGPRATDVNSVSLRGLHGQARNKYFRRQVNDGVSAERQGTAVATWHIIGRLRFGATAPGLGRLRLCDLHLRNCTPYRCIRLFGHVALRLIPEAQVLYEYQCLYKTARTSSEPA